MLDVEDGENREVEKRKKALAKWVQNPLTQLTVSLIENTSDKEALAMLVEATFAAGWNAGSAAVVGDLARHVMSQKTKNPSAGDGKPNGPAGPEAQSETVKRGDQPRM